MLATDPTQPIAAGWSRVTVQFPRVQVFFDMPSDRVDAKLDSFEEYCASATHPMKLERLRYTANGAIAVGVVAEESMALGSVTREVVCTAALWMFVYQQPVALSLVPDQHKENRQHLEHFIESDGGFLLNCVAGANDEWSFSVSPVDVAAHGAAAMLEAGMPHGSTLN
jgi:hypothetical protein